ncbi:MAG TPA: glycosyltransferase family 4 protein [Pyrinomonadaceae bacterium]|jgi:glycosyltransferase involved in cell wall biosynthesis
MKPKRLGILTTHPIQYHSAWFRKLAAHEAIDVEILYCHRVTSREQAAAGFGVEFDWDVSLLDGYPHRFLKNVAKRPGITGFGGLDTPEIKKMIAAGDYDAVMINGWHYKSAWQAMRACWQSQTPVMVRSDSHLHTDRTALKRAAKVPFYRWFISKLDACLPVGKWSTDYFLHYGAPPERVFIVPHTIDTDYFVSESQRLEQQREIFRSAWALNTSATVFLFAGKFIDKKRPLDFVNAIHHARSRGANVEGLMVGDGPLRQNCEAIARAANLPVRFAGFLNQSEIARAYVTADALALASDGGETWGLVVNEAMTCGLPCFVSDQVGCGPDMITSETGNIFAMGDVKALGTMMSQFSSDKAQMKHMSVQAKKRAEQYSVSVAVERTVEAVEVVTR